MRAALIAATAALIAGPALAQKIPLAAAMAQCKSLNGPSTVAKANYDACVRAKSGKSPAEARPKGGITISGSARIGIVHESN